MKTIQASKGRIAIVDDEDFEMASKRKWSGKRYLFGSMNGRVVFLHRLIAGAKPGQHVDHINGDIYDNRRSNLRICTHAENMRNRKPNRNKTSCSKFSGVRFRWGRKPWQGYISSNGTDFFKSFPTEMEAARWRDFMAIELFGDFARLNLPDSKEIHGARTGSFAIENRTPC